MIKNLKNKIVPLLVFVALGFIALQLPINHLAGSKVNFTAFDLFAPVSGAFLGTPFGIAAVFLMQIANLALHGFSNIDRGTIIRLFPILFGVWFFAKRDRNSLLVPLIAIISFNLNPVGRSVWYFSLYWTIPFLVYPVVKKSLVARSLASTFVAHSAGGAIWIWAFNLPASVWQGLVPVVALERAVMALGICASYILVNNLISMLSTKKIFSAGFLVDKEFLFKVK